VDKGLLVGLLTMMSASLASADPITIPGLPLNSTLSPSHQALAPGSSYFLAFVTADTHDALSSDIGVYDAFVTAEADLDPTLAALDTTWKVIGSTRPSMPSPTSVSRDPSTILGRARRDRLSGYVRWHARQSDSLRPIRRRSQCRSSPRVDGNGREMAPPTPWEP